MLFAPTADHPFANGGWETALLILISVLFTATFIWLWWRSKSFEPELEDEEIGDEPSNF